MTEEIIPYQKVLDTIEEGVYFFDNNKIITYWNKAAELITGFKSSEVIGKTCSNCILIHVDERGKILCKKDKLCPITRVFSLNTVYKKKLYLRHKDGYRIPVLITSFPFINKDGKITGGAEIFKDISDVYSLKNEVKNLKKLSFLDPLTKVGNRRYLEKTLYSKIEEFKKYNLKLGILFIDIDDFKSINDKYGHHIGDKVLRVVANTLANNIRSSDIVFRIGGEEFIVVVENSNKKGLYTLAEKLRILVEKSIILMKNNKINVTISIGATLIKKGDTIKSLLKRADELMYKSKMLGKNYVSVK